MASMKKAGFPAGRWWNVFHQVGGPVVHIQPPLLSRWGEENRPHHAPISSEKRTVVFLSCYSKQQQCPRDWSGAPFAICYPGPAWAVQCWLPGALWSCSAGLEMLCQPFCLNKHLQMRQAFVLLSMARAGRAGGLPVSITELGATLLSS